jgi:hypothetical protein
VKDAKGSEDAVDGGGRDGFDKPQGFSWEESELGLVG